MPVKSRAQQAFLAIHHPKILKEWSAEYGNPTNLPEHVSRNSAHGSRGSTEKKE